MCFALDVKFISNFFVAVDLVELIRFKSCKRHKVETGLLLKVFNFMPLTGINGAILINNLIDRVLLYSLLFPVLTKSLYVDEFSNCKHGKMIRTK